MSYRDYTIMSYGEYTISYNDLEVYWERKNIKFDSDSNDPDMAVYFKTHIISANEAIRIWKNRENYEWSKYNTPSDTLIYNYYKYFKQGNVKNPVITLITDRPKSITKILDQNHDFLNKYDYLDNTYYLIAFTMYDIIKDLLIPENVQIIPSPLNNNLYVCRYVDETGKTIYLRNENNINEFDNKEDIYKQVYKLLSNRIYKKNSPRN